MFVGETNWTIWAAAKYLKVKRERVAEKWKNDIEKRRM